LTYALLLRALPDDGQALAELGWLALLGTVADLGLPRAAALPGVAALVERWPKRDLSEAVALLNAARRAPVEATSVAQAVLAAARAPGDIARGRLPGVETLRAARRAVNAEVQRCARVAPRFYGPVAVLRFSSPAQIHALIATRWVSRLPKYVVLAANDGYLPGRVSFSMRAFDRARDLVALVRGIGLGLDDAGAGAGAELGHGHAQATGGNLAPDAFERLLAAFAALCA
jgi:hypothetical protein